MENDQEAVATLLVQRGAKTEVKNKDGLTALHLASKKGYVGVAKQLLGKGALINSSGAWKQTAVCLALENGHPEIVDLLVHNISHKIKDVDKRMDELMTTLLKVSHNDAVKYIEEHKKGSSSLEDILFDRTDFGKYIVLHTLSAIYYV